MKTITILSLAGLLLALCCSAQETPDILRQGQFREITSAGAAGYSVLSLRMSADGSTIVFVTTNEAFPDAVRVIQADGSNERVIFEESEERVEQAMDSIAISDDGSLIVYGRVREPITGQTELVLYHTGTGTEEILLRDVPHRTFGTTIAASISHADNPRNLALSGNGQFVYFINPLGPVGPNFDEEEVSGQTLYRVSTQSKVPQPLLSQGNFDAVQNISPDAVEFMTISGSIATNFEGTFALVAVSGPFAAAQPPFNLLRIEPTNVGVSSRSIVDLTGSAFSGPSLTADGATAVFTRIEGDPPTGGVFRISSDGTSVPTLIDGGIDATRHPIHPLISRDGSAVTDRIFGDLRWLDSGGGPIIPVNVYTTAPAVFDEHALSGNGQRLAFVGFIRSDALLRTPEIIVFDWAGAGGGPAVDSVVVDPALDLPIHPTIFPERTTSFTFEASGDDLGDMHVLIYDDLGQDVRGLQLEGMGNAFDRLPDDGQNGDAVVGDGLYNDPDIRTVPGAEPGTLTARGAVTSFEGTASFIDFDLTVRNPIVPAANFTAEPKAGEAPLLVTFADISTGDATVADYDFTNSGGFNISDARGPVQFTYTEPGVYSVRMRSRGFGNEDIVVKPALITVVAPEGEGEGGFQCPFTLKKSDPEQAAGDWVVVGLGMAAMLVLAKRQQD